MENDYSITIFSRNKGKTRTFKLNRRILYLPLAMLLVLVVSCIFFIQAYFQEREESQRLEDRIALLEQLMTKVEERSERQGGENPAQAMVETAVEPPVEVAAVQGNTKKDSETREPQIRIGGEREADGQSVARVDDAKVMPLSGDREGFEFNFKLVNLIGEPLAGNVAIIASLKPPHQPRFISFPGMRLEDGMPVKLRKSVGFSIRYFKYVAGKFAFPFSHSESFRILVYDQEEHLILDSTVPAEDVAVSELMNEEAAPLNEEAAPPAYPSDQSLSS
jgi:hypothetical protein